MNDDLKVKVAELSADVRYISKEMAALGSNIKELADSVKKLAEGLQKDVTALKIWQAEVVQKEKTNVSWWLKVEYYAVAAIGGIIGWFGKAFGIVKVVQ